MMDVEAQVAESFERLYPVPFVTADWDDVLERAKQGRRSRIGLFTPRTIRRRVGLVAGLAVVPGGAMLAAGMLGKSPPVLERARAALDPNGRILHIVARWGDGPGAVRGEAWRISCSAAPVTKSEITRSTHVPQPAMIIPVCPVAMNSACVPPSHAARSISSIAVILPTAQSLPTASTTCCRTSYAAPLKSGVVPTARTSQRRAPLLRACVTNSASSLRNWCKPLTIWIRWIGENWPW